jgi:hypothetical protein
MAVDATGAPLGPEPTLSPGQLVTVKATGFNADETVMATVFSTPRELGSSVASSSGIVSYLFAVPVDLEAGNHTLQLKGSGLTSAFAFRMGSQAQTFATTAAGSGTVGSANGPVATPANRGQLPRTGLDIAPLLLAGLLLVWAGLLVLLEVHRPAGRHRR